MPAYLTIGEFSRLTFLSVKALRHYHEVGLLAPVLVDPMTGYRSYATAQVPVAQVIRRLRELEMPLEDIRSVVSAPDDSARDDAILGHLTRMERQLERTKVAVDALRSLLEPSAAIALEYRVVPQQWVLARRGHVALIDSETWVRGALRDLARHLHRVGQRPVGLPGALFTTEVFSAPSGDVTAFVPIAEALPDLLIDTEIMMLPRTTFAVMLHHGPYSQVCHAYGELGSRVAERGVGVEGPTRENFLVTPADTDDEAAFRTEVCWPVRADAVPIVGV